MTTLFLQAAYRVSTEELFHNDSLLKDLVPMAKTEFNLSWKCLAEKKMLPTSEIRTARQDAQLLEKLETIVNTVCFNCWTQRNNFDRPGRRQDLVQFQGRQGG